jgi:hypothetical protein
MITIKTTNPRAIRQLHIVTGTIDDYRQFARWHYRDNGNLGPYSAIYCLRQRPDYPGMNADKLVGVIVYCMPTAVCTARDIATRQLYNGLGRRDKLALLNRDIRRISRVIIEPRYRGCGLAGELVRRTMPFLNVPIIEAMATMGHFNPFFEKAGMSAYNPPQTIDNKIMLESLSIVGIEYDNLKDCSDLQNKIDSLNAKDKEFINNHLRNFACHIKRRSDIDHPAEYIEQIWIKLSIRPVYYIWFNPNKVKK